MTINQQTRLDRFYYNLGNWFNLLFPLWALGIMLRALFIAIYDGLLLWSSQSWKPAMMVYQTIGEKMLPVEFIAFSFFFILGGFTLTAYARKKQFFPILFLTLIWLNIPLYGLGLYLMKSLPFLVRGNQGDLIRILLGNLIFSLYLIFSPEVKKTFNR